MSPSTERWLVAWLLTPVVTPFVVFPLIAFVDAVDLAGRTINLSQLLATFAGTRFVEFAISVAALTVVPMVIVGVPASILLERRGATSFLAYAVCGAAGGLASTVTFFIYAAGLSEPTAMVALVIGLGALYGAVAAVTFRLFRGPAAAA
jgi:hypothetical protein